MKILHLPGVDLELFKEHLDLTNTHELIPTAEYYASYLENANEIKIDTSNKKNSFSLTINLDSNRRVFKEIGSVERGQIGQLPPGEVFIAPKEFTAEGEIIINGSAPQRVFRENDLILLSFSKGVLNLTDSRFSKTINGTCFEKELRDYEDISKLNVTLGEFGIGINKNYRKLTGKPIRDEKVFGTCHIALGENSVFQGIIECESHIDLIFYPDEITVDGKRLPLI